MAKDPSMVIIRGRLAADPELRTVGAQATPVVNLRILSSGWEKDTAGQPVDLIDQPAGGKADVPHADVQPLG